jgi:hypothetical protein
MFVNEFVNEWINAEKNGDVQLLTDLLNEDFIGVGPVGFILSKQQWIDRYKNGLKNEDFNFEIISERAHDNSTIIIGTQSQKGDFKGYNIDGTFRVTLILNNNQENLSLLGVHLCSVND